MLLLPDAGKRWESACERWRRPGELFQPSEYGVDVVPAGQEQGHAYAERLLLSYGCDPRRRGESPRDWISRVVTAPRFRRMRHPGNLVYLFGIDAEGKASIERRQEALPYAEVKAATGMDLSGSCETPVGLRDLQAVQLARSLAEAAGPGRRPG